MKVLATINAKNREDALKYAYAFMKTDQLNLKECSFMNPKPNKFDKNHVFPRDMISASYTEKVPVWEEFKVNPSHLSSPGFTCVASVDKKDKKRVILAYLGDVISFNFYGNYENEAKTAFDNIVSNYKKLA